jgi:hypothetical protein
LGIITHDCLDGLAVCLHAQIILSNWNQTLPVFLYEAQIRQSKHNIKHD